MMLSLMFKPPSILQSDIIMEFSITTSDDIIVLSPMLALGPIRADLRQSYNFYQLWMVLSQLAIAA